MQVRSGEPKLFESGSAWGDMVDEGPANGHPMLQWPRLLTVARGCFCGTMASAMRGAIDQPQRRAKTKSHVSLPASQERVDDASPRCSAQSRLHTMSARASWPCKPPQTASKPPCLLLPHTPEDIPFAFGPFSPIPCVTINQLCVCASETTATDWVSRESIASCMLKHEQTCPTYLNQHITPLPCPSRWNTPLGGPDSSRLTLPSFTHPEWTRAALPRRQPLAAPPIRHAPEGPSQLFSLIIS
jgi:hypothetical protein